MSFHRSHAPFGGAVPFAFGPALLGNPIRISFPINGLDPAHAQARAGKRSRPCAGKPSPGHL